MMGVVREVERAAMVSVAKGGVQLDQLASIFAGCPRIAALCDNYLKLPGVRPPPPFDIAVQLPALVAEHGVILLVARKELSDTFWIVADVNVCMRLRETRPAVFEQVATRVEEEGEIQGVSRSLCIFTPCNYDISDFEDIHPCYCTTWLPRDPPLTLERHTSTSLVRVISSACIDLVMSPRYCIYSRDLLSDFTREKGVARRFGPPSME
jgi:hypothetical protein